KVFLSRVTETMIGSFLPGCSFSICCAFGNRTSFPRCSIGVTTMKMISNTSTTSTSGVTLISFLMPRPGPTAIAIASALGPQVRQVCRMRVRLAAQLLCHHIQELIGRLRDVHRAGIHPALEKVVEHHRRNRDQQTEGGGHQRLGDASRYGAQAAGPGDGH